MQNEIIFDVKNKLGIVTLNRPQALNAINLDMIQALNKQLTDWEKDAAIQAVFIQGVGEKAFCAGGDIRAVYQAKQQQIPLENLSYFFADEYQLNQHIKEYTKPYIAFMDGITMGGGVGISVHGKYRIATERLTFAMPETAIGFFPDIGGSYFLSRCPGQIGTYLALTGDRLNAADALYAGLVDMMIPSSALSALIADLSSSKDFEIILKQYAVATEAAKLAEHREEIDHCFAPNSIEEILIELENYGTAWCENIVKSLLIKSPTSLKVTLAQLRKGAKLDFRACMQMELKLAKKFLADHDFFEGIRAIVIDKDQRPCWQPATIKEVNQEIIDHYFA